MVAVAVATPNAKANVEEITEAAAIIKLHRNDNLRKVATANQELVSKKVSKEVSSVLYHKKKATPLSQQERNTLPKKT